MHRMNAAVVLPSGSRCHACQVLDAHAPAHGSGPPCAGYLLLQPAGSGARPMCRLQCTLGACCRNLAARFIDDEAEMSGSDSGDEGSQSQLSGDFISYAGTQALAGTDGSVEPCRWALQLWTQASLLAQACSDFAACMQGAHRGLTSQVLDGLWACWTWPQTV